MNNETKTGRGGARPNSGKKSSGIETVTVRIDKRLLNTVTGIKADFKDGKSLDDITSPKNDDAKLLKKIAALNNKNQHLCDCLENEKQARNSEVRGLKNRIASLNESIDSLIASEQTGGLDEKLRKRLIQFMHPDKHQDEKVKAIASELVKELNKMGAVKND